MADPSLAAFLATLTVVAAAVGAYIGIARARAPFGVPESQATIDRREQFKADHLRGVRVAVIVTGALLVAATAWLIAAHA